MTSKEKIITYLTFKEISQRKFSLKTGLSEGILRAGKHLGVDKMKVIKTHYPDLNMDWVIFGVGDMILENVNESEIEYESLSSKNEKLIRTFIFKCVKEYLDSENLEVRKISRESSGENEQIHPNIY